MTRFVSITVAAVTLLAAACAMRPGSCALDKRLVGTWRTSVRDTQLGRGYDEIEFRCDCTFRAKMTLIDADLTLRSEGSFRAIDGVLELRASEKTTIVDYEFQDGKLIERERPEGGTDIFEYAAINTGSCGG
jgi:hypothetical protein